jgi:hypothetical protein
LIPPVMMSMAGRKGSMQFNRGFLWGRKAQLTEGFQQPQGF